MAQNIYIVTNKKTKPLADRLKNQFMVNGVFESENLELTSSILEAMARDCKVEYFYVIVTSGEINLLPNWYEFKPPYWDNVYVHIWHNDKVLRLFNKKIVLANPDAYSDASLLKGEVLLKNVNKKMFEYPLFDIVFLSYDEFTADASYDKLKIRFPRSKRIDGIKGIHLAHKEAAKIADTSMFYVVDADAQILPTFNFKQPPNLNVTNVYIWHSRNPVNDLEYGYGGVKLFPTHSVLSYTGTGVDFTTSVADGLCVVPDVANITKFDVDPFSTWRSAFRECVKLSSKIIDGQQDAETEERLRIWQTIGNGQFGNFSVDGANQGATFGKMFRSQPNMLRLINDFDWLKSKFNSQQ